MARNTEKKEPTTLAEVAGNVYSGIISVFTCIILAAFPLYYENYYFNILKAKYKFYWMTVLAMIVVCLLVGIVFLFVDRMEYGGANAKRFFGNFRWASLKKQPFAYKTLVIFWALAALSTALSDYKYEAFWGNEGRFSGLFLITLYVISVFLIGKLGRFRKWHLDLFLFSGVLVCLFGITDYFQMDVLGWKANVKPEQGMVFTSFLGNVNTYTAFAAMVVGTACSLFATEKNVFRSMWYYAVVLISFFAIITGQSDNAYLALGALFAFLPFALFASRKGTFRYAVLVASFMSVIWLIAEINVKMSERVIGLTGLFNILTKYGKLEMVVISLWGLAGLLFAGNRVWGNKKDEIGKWLRILWLCIIASAAAAAVYLLYDANFGGHPERYEALSEYLVFNDKWGTYRGYCWRIAWESYRELPILQRLFGFGPDTFGILTWGYREEAISLLGYFYESAHNEYLQYLVTIGPFGTAAYMLFLGSGLIMMVRAFKEQPWILAAAISVLCYSVQAVVNINLPIATPIMWTFMAIGIALCRKDKNQADTGSGKAE